MASEAEAWKRVLPSERPLLRPAGHGDLSRIATFVNRGRREHVFAGDPDVTPASFRAYRRELERRGATYECLVVGLGGHDVAYVDFAARGRTGTILGLYVDKPARRQGLGAYVAAFAVNALIERGCTEIEIEILP